MEMDKKQSTLLILTIAAFGFLSYQIYRLVNDDLTQSPVHLSAQVATPVAIAVNPKNANHSELADNAMAIPEVQNTKTQMVTTTQAAVPLARDEKAYLNLVDQYQLARMERQLLEEQAAIAQARNRIALLNKKTAELDGGVTPVVQMVTQQANATNPKITNYTLSYLDKQNQQWSATLFHNGQYQEVMPGSALDQGVVVAKISHKGVLLQKGKFSEWITFNGIEIAAPEAIFAANKSQNATTALNPKVLANIKIGRPRAQVDAKNVMTASKTSDTQQQAPSLLQQQFTAHESAVLDMTPNTLLANKKKLKLAAANKQNPQVKNFAQAAHQIPLLPEYWQQQNTTEKIAPVKNESQTESMPDTSVVMNLAQNEPADSATTATNAPKTEPQIISLQNKEDPSLAAKTPPYSPDEQHLMVMRNNDYTIELIASYHESVINNFDRINELGKNVNQYFIYNDGKEWHMLLYGDYKTYEEAQVALNNLPANLKAEGPWIRKVSDVQRDLRGRLQV